MLCMRQWYLTIASSGILESIGEWQLIQSKFSLNTMYSKWGMYSIMVSQFFYLFIWYFVLIIIPEHWHVFCDIIHQNNTIMKSATFFLNLNTFLCTILLSSNTYIKSVKAILFWWKTYSIFRRVAAKQLNSRIHKHNTL